MMVLKACLLLLVVLSIVDSARLVSRSRSRDLSSRSRSPRLLRPKGEAVEDLFNVYDPSFLAVVWPKISNGVHLFLEPICWRDASVLFKDLTDGRAWAYTAVDASGRYESGLFKGNTFWLGSKEECFQLDDRFSTRISNESVDEFHNGDYLNAVLKREKYFDGGAENWRSLVQRDELMRRLVIADNSPPYHLAYTAVHIGLNLTKVTMAEAYSVTLGVCLPKSCSTDDVASIINFSIMINDNLKSNKTIPRSVKLDSLRQIREHYDTKRDIGAVLLICVTILLFIITLVATAVDLKWMKCTTRKSKSMSFDLQKFNNHEEGRIFSEEKSHTCDVLTKKESNMIGSETLTINNINNSNNINLVTVKKVMKPSAVPPSITLDVVSMERVTGNCKRCGKYKKQCNSNNPRHADNLPACPRVKSFASITTEPKRKDNLLKSLLLCFSLCYSWKRIFNTNMANKDLSVIHILKIVATFWVIFIHVSMIANYASDNGGDINERNNAYYILLTGTLAFDTLFFASGLFSAHHFFFLKSQYSVEELVSFGGACGQGLQFVCFVTNRAIRLLPSYIYVIFLSGVVSRVIRQTSPIVLPDADYTNCDTYWWRNVLYMTNVFAREEQCMQISWYMSLESQLHVCGALACACSVGGGARRVVAAAVLAAVAVSTAADVTNAYTEYGGYLTSVYAAYWVYVARGLARVAPYFIGMFAGWLVIRLDGDLHVSKKRSWFLWCACACGAAGALTLPLLCEREWLASWAHPLWTLALLWPAIVSATTILGASGPGCAVRSPVTAALSRLSYGALLLHAPIARLALLAGGAPLCADTVCLWWYFAGSVCVTFLCSLALALVVETPACSLLRRLSDYAS